MLTIAQAKAGSTIIVCNAALIDLHGEHIMRQERELIALDELSSRLTSQLQESIGALDSKIEIQYTLLNQDEDGCNWSGEAVVTPARNMSTEKILQLAFQLIQSARTQYNIK